MSPLWQVGHGGAEHSTSSQEAEKENSLSSSLNLAAMAWCHPRAE